MRITFACLVSPEERYEAELQLRRTIRVEARRCALSKVRPAKTGTPFDSAAQLVDQFASPISQEVE